MNWFKGIEKEENPNLSIKVEGGVNHLKKAAHRWMNYFLTEILGIQQQFRLRIIPIGSITLHPMLPNSSKNLLLCLPNLISFCQIVDSFVPFLRIYGMFKDIAIIRREDFLIMSLRIESNKVELSFCFLPCKFCQIKTDVNLLNCLSPDLDPISLLALNSLRNCIAIRRKIKPFEKIFQITLFYLKKWAIIKLVYSDSAGEYLNGLALGVMLTYSFSRSKPSTNIIGNLYIFFRNFIEINWETTVISLRNITSLDCFSKLWKSDKMKIVTPTKPFENCTRNVTNLSLNRIMYQFRDGIFLLEKRVTRLSLDCSLMKPLSLVDFVDYVRSCKCIYNVLLVSIIETKSHIDAGRFYEFENCVKQRLKEFCKNLPILRYPLSINNVDPETNLRIRHVVLVHFDTLVIWNGTNPLGLNYLEMPDEFVYRVELIDNDYKLLSLNFDNALYVGRLIESRIHVD